jgi:hypothetical protein
MTANRFDWRVPTKNGRSRQPAWKEDVTVKFAWLNLSDGMVKRDEANVFGSTRIPTGDWSQRRPGQGAGFRYLSANFRKASHSAGMIACGPV